MEYSSLAPLIPPLLVQDHKVRGSRIWEIRRGGEKMLSFLTVFDAEWQGRLMLYGLIAGLPAADGGRGLLPAAQVVTLCNKLAHPPAVRRVYHWRIWLPEEGICAKY